MDAFESFNFSLLGVVKDRSLDLTLIKSAPTPIREVWADTRLDTKVALVEVFPGMSSEIIDFYVERRYRGIVIEGFGAGHVNVSKEKEYSILESIKNAVQNGVLCFMCSQCLEGFTELKYDVGRELAKVSVVNLGDMLSEVALVKLMYVAGHTQDTWKIKKLMQRNIAGEITSSLPKHCPKCGMSMPQEARYCHHCGEKLEVEVLE